MSCKCAEPLRSPNPRHADNCNRCGRKIEVPLLLTCARCGHRFDAGAGRASVYLSGGANQLRDGRAVHLCGECEVGLRSWLGIAPQA